MAASPCAADCPHPHHAPAFVLAANVTCARYAVWLDAQSRQCRDRDRGWPARPNVAAYAAAIHRQVVRSGGADFYTGKPIMWQLLNHKRPTMGGRRLHVRWGRGPSIDHYAGLRRLDFRICAGVVNYAKGALTHGQFVDLCRNVVAHATR